MDLDKGSSLKRYHTMSDSDDDSLSYVSEKIEHMEEQGILKNKKDSSNIDILGKSNDMNQMLDSNETTYSEDREEAFQFLSQGCTTKAKGKPYEFKKTNSSLHTISDSESDVEETANTHSSKSSHVPQMKKMEGESVGCKRDLSWLQSSHSSVCSTGPAIKKPRLDTQQSCSSNRMNHDNDSNAPSWSFFLTKVKGIPDEYNSIGAIHIRDILSVKMGNLIKSAQFNYMFDIPWLVSQYPAENRKKPLLIIHGSTRETKATLDMDASRYDNIRTCQAKLEMMYGTHHTKMMFLLYETGLRIVIHTANLIERDWYQKTQGVWISPVCPKLPNGQTSKGDSATHFKRDLLEYLAAYKSKILKEWEEHIQEHDMSDIGVYLIASVPGRHTGERKTAFGHLKLRKVLQDDGPEPAAVQGWPVVGQFSSIGSLGASKDNWLCAEWLNSLSSCRGTQTMLTAAARLQLVFPSKENIRTSLEGYPAGASVPYSINVAKKQTWLNDFFHCWKSDVRGRSQACPHIKTYLRGSPDFTKLAWFLVTSANLSKAAWGALEKKDAQLMIRSYEIGVLFIPKHYNKKHLIPAKNVSDLTTSKDLFPVPYDLPLTAYGAKDKPWIWDIPYVDKPDTNGNKWCPS